MASLTSCSPDNLPIIYIEWVFSHRLHIGDGIMITIAADVDEYTNFSTPDNLTFQVHWSYPSPVLRL